MDQVIQEINELFKGQKLSTLTIHDEHMLLRVVAKAFHNAYKTGRIDSVPAFTLDADANGSMIVKLLPEETRNEVDNSRF